MNITPGTYAAIIGGAIREAFDTWADREEAAPGLDVDWIVERVYASVSKAHHAAMPALVSEAFQQPAVQEQIMANLVPGVLAELEDSINDEHDSPKTDDVYRPGLRRAARLVRETRRAADGIDREQL